MTLDTSKLTYADLAQLLAYAQWNEADDGCYYGNKQAFAKRHLKLVRWLEAELEQRRVKA